MPSSRPCVIGTRRLSLRSGAIRLNTDPPIITVTLNPAIDRTLEISGFAAGRVNRVQAVHDRPGGKGVNVSAALAELGASTIATGFLGRDNAQLFENLLARKRIDDQFIRIAGETRVGIKISDPESGKTTDINFPGIKLPATGADEIKSRLKSLLRPGQWVVLAGSVPPGVEPAIYATLCDLVHSAGGQVALDTSGPPLAAALAMRPALVKPNADELAELIGRPLRVPQDIVSAARQSLIDAGVTLAVVSMGGDGAIFVTANEAIRAHAPQVRVVSTVGAGDAMVAGLVFALSHKCPLEEAARLATALGTRAVSQPRHDGGTPTPYEPYLARVRIEKMS